MGQREDIHRAQLRAQQFCITGKPGLDQVVAQQTELVHRKTMLRRELRAVVIVVNQRHGHRDFTSERALDINSAVHCSVCEKPGNKSESTDGTDC